MNRLCIQFAKRFLAFIAGSRLTTKTVITKSLIITFLLSSFSHPVFANDIYTNNKKVHVTDVLKNVAIGTSLFYGVSYVAGPQIMGGIQAGIVVLSSYTKDKINKYNSLTYLILGTLSAINFTRYNPDDRYKKRQEVAAINGIGGALIGVVNSFDKADNQEQKNSLLPTSILFTKNSFNIGFTFHIK